MSNTKLAKLLTGKLPFRRPNLFNPWRDRCPDCKRSNGPDAKLARLAAHLCCFPEFILCGEASSHRGCKHSGIAFTSERQLCAGEIPRIPPMSYRLTSKASPYSESSATIVWETLRELHIEERTILWNALPMHPHRRGEPGKNRTPTPAEVIEFGKYALQKLIAEFPSAKVVAVGRKAEKLLCSMDIDHKPVRHPANGGKKQFKQGLERLIKG
jgi:hypothetical protein